MAEREVPLLSSEGGGVEEEFDGNVTATVVMTCIMAASGGLIFGYDIGISGGVTTMESFLEKFFPNVIQGTMASKPNKYCVYDNEYLSAFTSSLYIAGFFSSLFAGRITKAVGRRNILLIGAAMFFVGSSINGAAVNIQMLIIGRILLGFGVGFTNQVAPLYLSEVAPPKWRGAFNTGFQFCIGIGVVVANFTNYGTAGIPTWGWRLSLGLGTVPAAILFTGATLIPDTPTSLLERGDHHGARLALRRIRGPTVDIEPELKHMARCVESSRPKDGDEGPFRKILMRKKYRQHVVMAVAIPIFQQMTGINVIAFYAPILFRTVGYGSNSALIGAVVLGVVNIVAILVSTFVVDRCGRKVLFLEGGAQMIICQVHCEGSSNLRVRSHYRRRWNRQPIDYGLDSSANFAVRLRGGVRMVMGSAELVGPQRDIPQRDQVGRAKHKCGGQPRRHIRVGADVSCNTLSPEVLDVRVPRWLDSHHDYIRGGVVAGDQGCSTGVDGRGLAKTLVLEETLGS